MLVVLDAGAQPCTDTGQQEDDARHEQDPGTAGGHRLDEQRQDDEDEADDSEQVADHARTVPPPVNARRPTGR